MTSDPPLLPGWLSPRKERHPGQMGCDHKAHISQPALLDRSQAVLPSNSGEGHPRLSGLISGKPSVPRLPQVTLPGPEEQRSGEGHGPSGGFLSRRSL